MKQETKQAIKFALFTFAMVLIVELVFSIFTHSFGSASPILSALWAFTGYKAGFKNAKGNNNA